MRTLLLGLAFFAACDNNGRGHGADLGVTVGDASVPSPDGGMSCLATEPDQMGCACTDGPTRSCWPASADARARKVGICQDGTQTCNNGGEFSTYGACTGAVLPATENCTNGIDDDCNGTIDCNDPGCATQAACQTGCTNGQQRPCYTGPSGTDGVGTCHGGMQTCAGGQWPSTCTGQVTPTAEDCTDAKDHDCNHLPGCLDLFACILSPACMSTCTTPDPMCVCPMGSGDTATCPGNMHGITVGATLTNPGMTECCPCTASDCGDPACCDKAVCAGNAKCAGLTCAPLPSSCNGRVNADCDDFPEDCDEPCCPCRNCP